METKQRVDDRELNTNWVALLKIFHGINRKEAGAKEKYLSLIELTKSKPLAPRQVSGIIERCQYQVRLIETPDETPFANNERQEKRLNLPKEQSNGKP